jgi:hypothetical protein
MQKLSKQKALREKHGSKSRAKPAKAQSLRKYKAAPETARTKKRKPKMQNLFTLSDVLASIKKSIEDAIEAEGTEGKNNLIRSQKPINLLHEIVKSELVRNGVNAQRIYPKVGQSKGELSLFGYLKRKAQDICVVPNNVGRKEETLHIEGLLNGKVDNFGKNYTQRILSINVRSQLSSTEKNFDTLYERTYAEPLNLHLRCPKMVLGEFYMIVVRDYDSDAANKKKVAFKNRKDFASNLEKYILSFQAVNMRASTGRNALTLHRYERVCLLVVDFRSSPPKVFNTDDELKDAKLLPKSTKASIANLEFEGFITQLLETYSSRFGAGMFS